MKSLYLLPLAALVIALSARLGTAAEPDAESAIADPRLLELQAAVEHNDGSLCHLDPVTLEHEEAHYGEGGDEAAAGHGAKLVDFFNWGFEPPTGQFDQAQLKRGFAVFTQACSACHGIKYVGYRHLREIGIPAAVLSPYMQAHYPDGVQDENFVRTVGLQDNWPANRNLVNGAVPPDLSNMVRQQYKYLGAGTDYVFNLLLGYQEERQEENAQGGVNCFYKGEIIAMSAPLTLASAGIYSNAVAEGLLSEEAIPSETLVQYAADVSAFLAWTSDPNRDAMHRQGLFWLLFFALLSLVTYFTFRAVARQVHSDQEKRGGPWTD